MFAAVGLQPISTALAGSLVGLDVTALFVGAGALPTVLVIAVATRPSLRQVGGVDLPRSFQLTARRRALEESAA